MKKTSRIVLSLLACMAVMALSGCKDTAALKASVEELSKNCPVKVADLCEATAMTVGDKTLDLSVNLLPTMKDVDPAFAARYALLDLVRQSPDVLAQLVEKGFGANVSINTGEGDAVAQEIAPIELEAFSKELGASNNIASILLPYFNKQLTSKLPLSVAEGLDLKSVNVSSKGMETFQFVVDDDKTKFDDIRNTIGKTLEDVTEKVKLANLNLGAILPLLKDLNYGVICRYATKSGSKETFMEITADEVNKLLTAEPETEEKAE